MTDALWPIEGPPSDVSEEHRDRLEWEVPEVGAVIVLVTCGVLAVGGLAAAILVSETSFNVTGQFNSEFTGSSVSVGASWAGALLAFALLVVVGLGWWQAHAWGDALESDDHAADQFEAMGHIHRARRICRWATAALAVTFAGSVALLIGAILEGSSAASSETWAHIVIEAANALAVAAISWAGWWVARQCVVGPVPPTVQR